MPEAELHFVGKDFEDDVLGSASDDVKEKQTMSWEDVTKFLEDNL